MFVSIDEQDTEELNLEREFPLWIFYQGSAMNWEDEISK